MPGSASSPAARAICRLASRHCARPSTGASASSTSARGRCSRGSPCSPRAQRSLPPRVSAARSLDTLAALVDDHLLRREDALGEARFGMLETVREYALELLGEERPRAELAMVSYFAGLTDRIESEGGGALEPLSQLDAEIDNIRAALIAAERSGASDLRPWPRGQHVALLLGSGHSDRRNHRDRERAGRLRRARDES